MRDKLKVDVWREMSRKALGLICRKGKGAAA